MQTRAAKPRHARRTEGKSLNDRINMDLRDILAEVSPDKHDEALDVLVHDANTALGEMFDSATPPCVRLVRVNREQSSS